MVPPSVNVENLPTWSWERDLGVGQLLVPSYMFSCTSAPGTPKPENYAPFPHLQRRWSPIKIWGGPLIVPPMAATTPVRLSLQRWRVAGWGVTRRGGGTPTPRVPRGRRSIRAGRAVTSGQPALGPPSPAQEPSLGQISSDHKIKPMGKSSRFVGSIKSFLGLFPPPDAFRSHHPDGSSYVSSRNGGMHWAGSARGCYHSNVWSKVSSFDHIKRHPPPWLTSRCVIPISLPIYIIHLFA